MSHDGSAPNPLAARPGNSLRTFKRTIPNRVPLQGTPVENPRKRLKQCLTKHLRHSIISPRAPPGLQKLGAGDGAEDWRWSWEKDMEARMLLPEKQSATRSPRFVGLWNCQATALASG